MKVIKVADVPAENWSNDLFEGGTVNVKTLTDKHLGSAETRVALVTFPPNTRTRVHVHNHEQVLYILSGKGIVANDHEEHEAVPGMMFLIPAGERHWHGATPETSLTHLSVYNSNTETQ